MSHDDDLKAGMADVRYIVAGSCVRACAADVKVKNALDSVFRPADRPTNTTHLPRTSNFPQCRRGGIETMHRSAGAPDGRNILCHVMCSPEAKIMHRIPAIISGSSTCADFFVTKCTPKNKNMSVLLKVCGTPDLTDILFQPCTCRWHGIIEMPMCLRSRSVR